jgi:hypothetical protein
MRAPRRSGLLMGVAAVLSVVGMGAQQVAVAPPAKNWTLPLFTKEGFHQMTLRGEEVRPVSSDQVDISGLDVTVFSGDASSRVDTVILSPQATFHINEKVAHGESPVRVVRDDVEVTGIGWTYFYNEKKVLIAHDAHVVFHAALPDILK